MLTFSKMLATGVRGVDLSQGVPHFLIVCYGNICRSPMAQGIFERLGRSMCAPLAVDSAGVSGWHAGSPPDPRAMIAAARRGVDITNQLSRGLREADFFEADHILAVDRRVFATLRLRAPAGMRARLGMLMELAPDGDIEVPDPYNDGAEVFDAIYDQMERGARAQLEHVLLATVR
ncbi:low molecular weight protein-tyrosine-phosphatase [Rubrimonas cliftonensis]|uniref:protein-tyrosine-phosphatase n=1 Tax=Rubrimonas cliftonensis TaxID=89524 RepID=A0A1H4DTP3_9RHOB|nr:low molecular weight protein-tyrosine-phosphatase [Rubrimonas cliftonensis]SEA75888.1 protein tyrosine phosphatase [Rubrimonas cliftonensis]